MASTRSHRAPSLRSIGAACGALVIASTGLDCRRSEDWNGSFHRSEGWWYSDGAVSAELPGGKTVWLFGDTRLRDNANAMSNSIAVQDTAPGRAPAKSQIRFFVRGGQGELLDVSKVGGLAKSSWANPLAPERDALRLWLWPTAALVSGGRLVTAYVEMGCPVATFDTCRGYLGSMTVAGHTLVEVENPADTPEHWRTRATPLLDRRGRSPAANRLHWGSALFEDGGWLYVFGTSFGPKWRPEDVKVARSVPGDVGRYERWQFLTPAGWRMLPSGPTAVDLQTVARGGATELSVLRVVRRGRPWLVLLQQDWMDQELMVRSAPADTIESTRWDGPEAGQRVRRFSLPALDPETAGALSWSVRAHPQHSAPDQSLLVSFYSAKTAGLRFVELPIAALLD